MPVNGVIGQAIRWPLMVTVRQTRPEALPLDSAKGRAFGIHLHTKRFPKASGLWWVWAKPSLAFQQVQNKFELRRLAAQEGWDVQAFLRR